MTEYRALSTRHAIALLAALAAPIPSAHAAPYRDPWLQPFASGSLWNLGLGRGARWSRPEDADTIDLRHPNPAINAGEWSMPYFLGTRSDPKTMFVTRDTENPVPPQILPAPAGIHPALPRDGDRHIILFDPSKRWMLNYFGCVRSDSGFDCALAQKDDTCGEGVGGIHGFGIGVMRRWEIEAGAIHHMLRFSLPVTRLLSGTRHVGGVAWPAEGEDGFGPQRYSGHVLYGSTIGLPADVDIGALGLSPPGLALAKALQDYGALMRDSGGEHGVNFYAEESAEGLPQLDAMRRDLPKIASHLAILRNQGPASLNGGGPRRVPPAAPLDPKVCAR